MPLFAPPPTLPRAPDAVSIRRQLNGLLRLARNAERLPWSAVETARWERRFPEIAALLPDGEGDALNVAFTRELARLRKGRNAPAGE